VPIDSEISRMSVCWLASVTSYHNELIR
jgi:hypothetical protein